MFQFIKSIPLTFYSRPFYVNLIRRGKGIGTWYILLQALLFFFLITFSNLWGHTSISDMQKNIDAIFSQFPSITITEQKLSIDRPSPTVIDIPSDDKHGYIVFDMTPRDKDEAKIMDEMKSKGMLALVTPDFMALMSSDKDHIKKSKKLRVEFYDFKEFSKSGKESLSFSTEDWAALGKSFIPMISAFLLPAFFIVFLLVTFFKSLLIKAFAFFFTFKPDIAAAMRLSAAATIPVGFLRIMLVPFHLPIPFYVGLLITLAFAIFGLASANKDIEAEKNALNEKIIPR